MQIWLPEPNFAKSVHVLDTSLLWRQRHDVIKVIETLTGTSSTMTYRNHPLVSMWRGCEYTLAMYGMAACLEWRDRGNTDEMTKKFTEFMHDALVSGALPVEGHSGVPWWLGQQGYHDSHKAALVKRDSAYYGLLWPRVDMKLWRDMPVVWPEYRPPVPRGPENDKYLSITEAIIAQ
jgi:hypothetical protein